MILKIVNKINKVKPKEEKELEDKTKAEWFIKTYKNHLPYFNIIQKSFDGITIETEGKIKDEWCEEAIAFIERNGFNCDGED
jgi:hypothetical protein